MRKKKRSNPKLDSLSVFAPCFNEAKNIPSLVAECARVLPQLSKQFELIIVNDGSTDNTQSVIKELQRKHSFIRLVNHSKNKGYGAALQSGFKAAKHDWIFFTDGDHQFNVAELKQFLPHTEKYNVIIGYRKNRAEGSFRVFNAHLFKLFIDALFRVHVKDIDCAFKLIKRDVIQPLPLQSTGAMISAEFLYRLKKLQEPFKQLPVSHYPRKYGTPSGNSPKVILKAGWEALALYWDMKFGAHQATSQALASERANNQG